MRTLISVEEMDCPTEEAMIRGKLTGMAGIEGLDFNLMQRRLTLTHRPEALEPALKALDAIGLEGVVESEAAERVAPGPAVARRTWMLMGVAGIAAAAAELIDLFLPGADWLVIALSLFAIVVGGLRTYWKGFIALKQPHPQHERAHVGGGHRRHGHRRVARGGHGHGPLRPG